MTFPGDDLYSTATKITFGDTTRLPAVVVYAESENDVVEAVNCGKFFKAAVHGSSTETLSCPHDSDNAFNFFALLPSPPQRPVLVIGFHQGEGDIITKDCRSWTGML